MEPFATVEDYEARYGEVSDEAQLETLLSDASAFIASQAGFSTPTSDVGTANLVRVTCAVVHRSLMAGSLAGIQSYSEGAVGYTASVTPYNPSGDFYLTAQEKKSLGIGGSRVFSVQAAIDGWYGTNGEDDEA